MEIFVKEYIIGDYNADFDTILSNFLKLFK